MLLSFKRVLRFRRAGVEKLQQKKIGRYFFAPLATRKPAVRMKRKTFSQHDRKRSVPDKLSAPTSILIFEREASLQETIVNSLRGNGLELFVTGDSEQVLDEAARQPYDIVIASLQLAGVEGIDFLKRIKSLSPETEVIVTTTRDAMTRAFHAVDGGAYDYLVKPFELEEPRLAVQRALERRHLTQRVHHLEERRHGSSPLDDIAWKSGTMRELTKTVRQVARLDSPILIDGENGTGKELFARALHSLSPRRNEPFVIINCGVLPHNLQAAELFGHVEEAFVDHPGEKVGILEEANEGTVYLDEVGELALPAQASLLHLLQNGELTKVGTKHGRNIDVRVIAATQENLEIGVAEGRFKEDLYYRLSVIAIHIPPLRERPEDIPLLTQWFVEEAAERMGMVSPPAVSPRVVNSFIGQSWRGNVQELECAVERAVALDRDGIIGMDDLPLDESQRCEDKVLDVARKKALTLGELQREYILEVLDECKGSRKKTAERLGITTATLWRKLKRYETQPSTNR